MQNQVLLERQSQPLHSALKAQSGTYKQETIGPDFICGLMEFNGVVFHVRIQVNVLTKLLGPQVPQQLINVTNEALNRHVKRPDF